MVRDDYQVGVTFQVGQMKKQTYTITAQRGGEVLLEQIGERQAFWWWVCPERTHKIVSISGEEQSPYSNVIRKIREIKTRREALGYVY